MGLVALWLRLKLEETPSFQRVEQTPITQQTAAAETDTTPKTDTIQTGTDKHTPAMARPSAGEVAKAILLGIGRLMGWSAAGYTFLVVMPGYLQTALKASFQQALIATVLANLGFALTILPAGWLSDRVGRKPVMLTGTVLIIVLAWPLLNVLQGPGSLAVKGLAVFVAGAVVGLIAGPGPAMLSEMFPTTVRYTGLGLAYSLSNAVFSGSAGLIITALIKSTSNLDIPAFYVMATSVVSAFALATLRGRDRHRSLQD